MKHPIEPPTKRRYLIPANIGIKHPDHRKPLGDHVRLKAERGLGRRAAY